MPASRRPWPPGRSRKRENLLPCPSPGAHCAQGDPEVLQVYFGFSFPAPRFTSAERFPRGIWWLFLRGTRKANLVVVIENRGDFECGTDGPRIILAGIDGSASSLRAGAYAAGLARRQSSALFLVYVQPLMASCVVAGVDTSEITGSVAAEIVNEIESAIAHLAAIGHVRWTFHTFRGDPFNGLVSAARDLRADCIVVGASSSATRRLMGSVAVRLVKLGNWPVTVVP